MGAFPRSTINFCEGKWETEGLSKPRSFVLFYGHHHIPQAFIFIAHQHVIPKVELLESHN